MKHKCSITPFLLYVFITNFFIFSPFFVKCSPHIPIKTYITQIEFRLPGSYSPCSYSRQSATTPAATHCCTDKDYCKLSNMRWNKFLCCCCCCCCCCYYCCCILMKFLHQFIQVIPYTAVETPNHTVIFWLLNIGEEMQARTDKVISKPIKTSCTKRNPCPWSPFWKPDRDSFEIGPGAYKNELHPRAHLNWIVLAMRVSRVGASVGAGVGVGLGLREQRNIDAFVSGYMPHILAFSFSLVTLKF